MTIDWIDLIAEIKSHHCPPTAPKDCLDDELHCSVCWGEYIEELVLDEHKDDIVMNQATNVEITMSKGIPVDLTKIEQFNHKLNSKQGRYS